MVMLQTRFFDYDMFGHVNNTVYLQYLDVGKIHYFADVMGTPITRGRPSAVVVNINISFFSPAYPGEPLAVLTACTHLSERSFHLEQRVVNASSGDVKCVAYVVMAGFIPETGKGAPLQPDWIKALRAFDGDDI